MTLKDHIKICEEATPGEYAIPAANIFRVVKPIECNHPKKHNHDPWVVIAEVNTDIEEAPENANFIATFNPQKVKAMLELLEKAEDIFNNSTALRAKEWLKRFEKEFGGEE